MEHLNHMAHSYLHHGLHDSHHLDELIQANHISNGHQSLADQIHAASAAGISETAEVGRDIADGIRDSINASSQIGNINLQSTERNGGETRSSVERAAGVVRDHIAANANQSARDHGTIVGEICDVRKEMSDGFGNTNLEMVKGHGDIKLEACKNHGETARLIEAKAAEQARLSERLAAEAAKQLAECCCRLEGEHASTRQLLQAQALDECRRREGNLANENSFLKLQASLGGNGPGPFAK